MAMSVVYSNAFGGIIAENRGGAVSTYLRDTLGSTIGLMNSAGSLTDRWEYWLYGEIIKHSGSSATPFTFLGVVGYFVDLAVGLYYVRMRHLSASLGRWLTVDPQWPSQQAYGYCASQPCTCIDPSGEDFCETGYAYCQGAAVAAYSGCQTLVNGLATTGVAACAILCAAALAADGPENGALICILCFAALVVTYLLALWICQAKFSRQLELCTNAYCGCEKTFFHLVPPGC